MERYYGTETVGPGIYFNAREFSFRSMNDEGTLPGNETDEYRRVPAPVLLVAGPLVGLVYIAFLPVIGFAMVLWFLAGKVVDLAIRAAIGMGRVLEPAWQPAMAFLSRRKNRSKERKHRDEWATKVEKELDDSEKKS